MVLERSSNVDPSDEDFPTSYYFVMGQGCAAWRKDGMKGCRDSLTSQR